MEEFQHGSPPPDFRSSKRQRQKLADPAKEDRELPNSPESELAILGCCLLSPKESIGTCIEKLQSSEVFFSLVNRTIYECLLAMYSDNVEIDLVTLLQELRDLCQLESVGGLAFLQKLPDATPSHVNLPHYVEIVLEKFTLRKGIAAATEFISKAYENQGEASEIIEELDSSVREIVDGAQNRGTFHTTKTLVPDSVNRFEKAFENKGQLSGIATGFIDLDRLTNGLQNGEMIVIAARPSEGKSTYVINIADYVAVELKLPVLVFSLEMTAASILDRAICSRARVDLSRVRDGNLMERDFPRLTAAASQLRNAPLYIDDACGTGIMQLRAKARRYHQQYGIRLLALDYLQLITSSKKRVENRRQEIAEVSNGIKSLAKELEIPIIAVAQLNREIEKGNNRKPRMSDIRDAGEIEQDADLIGFLYKPTRKSEEPGHEQDAIAVNLLVAKNRNGRTGDLNFTFLRQFTRFETASKFETEEPTTPYNDY